MDNATTSRAPVSIVMPVYNEEAIIERTVRDYHAEVIRKLPGSEMIIVDDCSTDESPAILRRLAGELGDIDILRPEKNGGHGRALRRGYENASRELIFHTDSDYQFEPREFWKLYERMGANDLVSGYRAVRHDPFPRHAVSYMLRLSNIVLFGFDIRDANSPFKIVREDCLRECLRAMDPEAFAPSVLLAVTARRKGYRTEEVPVTHLPRLTGAGSIRKLRLIRACLRSLRESISLRRSLGRRERSAE